MITLSIIHLLIIGIFLIPFFNYFYKKNFELFLIILIIFGFNLMYLVKIINFFSKGFILVIPFLIYIFLKEAMQKRIKIDGIGVWVLVYIFILFFGIIVAYMRGQAIKLGLLGAVFYGILLVYFSFRIIKFCLPECIFRGTGMAGKAGSHVADYQGQSVAGIVESVGDDRETAGEYPPHNLKDGYQEIQAGGKKEPPATGPLIGDIVVVGHVFGNGDWRIRNSYPTPSQIFSSINVITYPIILTIRMG